MIRERRIIVILPNGQTLSIKPDGTKLDKWEIDLTGIKNANATAPLNVVVQEVCDHGSWHNISTIPLQCWDD